MALPAYVLKGAIRRAQAFFTSVTAKNVISTGIRTTSVVTGITASLTHTLAGATALTGEVNIISTCANAADSVSLPALTPGQSVDVYNAGIAAAAVYPAAAGVAIDGGSAGAPVTLTNAKRARFTCTAANVIVSAQYGVPSA